MMKITNVPVGDLKPYANNPRVITDDAVAALAASIRAVGWLRGRPVVADPDGIIIIGHTRVRAAKLLGRKTVPVLRVTLSAADAQACRILDNRTGEMTSWDYDALAAEMRALGDDITLLHGLWDDDELAALSAQIAAEVEAAAPLAPGTAHAAPAPAATNAGAKAARAAPAVACPNCGRPV